MITEVPLTSPAGWPRIPARRLFTRVRRSAVGETGVVTAFRDGEVTLRSNRRTEGFTNAVQEHGYQGVRSGDLVIHSMDGFAGAIGVSDSDGKCSPVVHCHLPSSQVDARFYAYLLRDLARQGFITSLAKGIRERSTAFDVHTFQSLALPVPPLAEQRAIADYLDAETARIDALITKKQQLIHLLEERWIARRGSLVLQGLQPTDGSGARLPGWEYPKLGVLIGLQRGHDLPTDLRRPGSVPIVSSGGVSGLHDTSVASPPGVVTGRYGTVGEVFFIEEEYWPLNTTLYVTEFRGNEPRWVAFLLESLPLDAESDKSAVGGINRNVIGDLRVPKPPLVEQRSMASELLRTKDNIEATQRALSLQVHLLRERRKSIITEAVTGSRSSDLKVAR